MQDNRQVASAIVAAGILGFALGLVPVAVTEPDESSFMPGLGNALRSTVVVAFGTFLVPIIPAAVIGRASGARRTRDFWLLVAVVVAAITAGTVAGYALFDPGDGADADGLSFLVVVAFFLAVIAASGALLGYVGGGGRAHAGRASQDALVWLAGIIAVVFTALALMVLSIVPNLFGAT